MLAAQKQGIAPEDMIARVREEHLADFSGFGIGYDNYYSTHSPKTKPIPEKSTAPSKPTAKSKAAPSSSFSTRKKHVSARPLRKRR